MKKTLFIIALIIYSCQISKSKEEKEKSDVKELKEEFNVQIAKEKTIDRTLLNGVWAENEDDNAQFYIENDSIYFIEHTGSPIAYTLIKDTLYLDYNTFKTYSIINKLTKDSLIMKNEGLEELTKLYRRRK